MQKILAFILTIAILFLTLYNSCETAEASDFVVVTETSVGITPVPVATSIPLENGNYNGAVYAAANVLTWEMLQTFLYGIAGQQACDTYADDKEAQEELYADYCDWWETTKKGTAMGFVGLVYTGEKISASADDVYSYYKTLTKEYELSPEDISADLEAIRKASEEAMDDIMRYGGIRPEVSGPPTPTPSGNNKDGVRIVQVAGIGTLIGCVGGYIKDLVEGKRGEVSEKFNQNTDIPQSYFSGSYQRDDMGNFVFKCTGTNVLDVTNGKMYTPIIFRSNVDVERYSRAAGYVYETHNIFDENYSSVFFAVYDNITKKKKVLSSELETFANGMWGEILGYRLKVKEAELANFADIPIFKSEAEALYYMETGNLNACVNYFNTADFALPPNWLDYQIAAIAAQLPQILQALTTLPTITTKNLADFAASINANMNNNAANIQKMTQAQLLEFMKKINTEAAKQIATNELAEENPYADNENTTGGGTGGNVGGFGTDYLPTPTIPPEIVEKQNNSRMMVDLSKFFPFCVPYDMIRLVKVLNATPKAPKFETSIKYTALGINEKIVLDLARFDDVARTVRLCETVLFILALILVTRNLIRG